MYAVFDDVAPDEETYAADDDERADGEADDGVGYIGVERILTVPARERVAAVAERRNAREHRLPYAPAPAHDGHERKAERKRADEFARERDYYYVFDQLFHALERDEARRLHNQLALRERGVLLQI